MLAIPSVDAMGGSVGMMAGWIGLLAFIGSRSDVSKSVATGLWLVNGLAWYFTPKEQSKIYKYDALSDFGTALQTIGGGNMLCVGVYLAMLQTGYSQAEAFAAAWATNGVTALKFALAEADGLGVPKGGPLTWAVLSGGIAALALN